MAAPCHPDRIGGINSSTCRLADALVQHAGIEVGLLSTVSETPPPCRYAASFGLKRGLSIGARLKSSLPEEWMTPNLVHFHSTYLPTQARIASYYNKRGIPYLLSPRGGLMDYALKQKRLKKQLGDMLFFKRYVRLSSGLHCLTARESEQAEAWHSKRHIAPNPIDIPPEEGIKRIESRDWNETPPCFLYAGRIDTQIKGLDRLVDSVRIAKQSGFRSLIRLAGPDHRGQRAALESRIRSYGLQDSFHFHGPCDASRLESLYQDSDVFILCSRSEGQPNALIEAMGHGLPCLITPETNMAECVNEYVCGWVSEGQPGKLANALSEIVNNPDEIANRSANARHAAEQRFTAPVVAERMKSIYQSILTKAGSPLA